MSLAKTTATLLIALSLASTTHGIATHDTEIHHDTIEASHAEPKHTEEHHKDLHEDSHVAATPSKNLDAKKIDDSTAKLKDKEFKSDVFDHINHDDHNKNALAVDHKAAANHDSNDYDEELTDDEGHHITKHVHGGPGFEAVSIKSDGPLKPSFIQHMM